MVSRAAVGEEKKKREVLPLGNEEVAEKLEQVAALLEQQGANPFRVQAYRTAAIRMRDLKEPVHEILDQEGRDALTVLPGIGEALARTIEEITHTGRSGLSEKLLGESSPERLLTTVAGIGPRLARVIHEQLGIETLEALEQAASDGRLIQVPLLGAKRIRAIREALAGRFRRKDQIVNAHPKFHPPRRVDVAELLDVDQEYRDKARKGQLPRITPRRFNPTHEAWLSVLHTTRGEHHYTALFSNTARAHEMGTIRDWVVLNRDDDGSRDLWTVVTGRYGNLQGRRIIRGLEDACEAHYAAVPLSKAG